MTRWDIITHRLKNERKQKLDHFQDLLCYEVIQASTARLYQFDTMILYIRSILQLAI